MDLITVEDIKEDKQVEVYLRKANEHLGEMGFTEHGFRHAGLTSNIAGNILTQLEYSRRMVDLAHIAGYLHDIGNVINRHNHAHSSALLSERILDRLGMGYEEIAIIIGAIGNHDEETGDPVNPVAAALIIADKSDVHCTRVRNKDQASFDIHDRVNYAAKESFVEVNRKKRTITLKVEVDSEVSIVMEYFEIFLVRMLMARRAARRLECNFHLLINNSKLI